MSGIDVRSLGTDDHAADPLLGFAFLQTFIDIFQEYFGGISLAIVKENFDVVYQVCPPSLPLRISTHGKIVA